MTCPIAEAIVAQPMPVARWSASGKGRPVRKTTAIGSSSSSSVRRYSARSPVFSEVRVVEATRSASSLQRRMRAMVYRALVGDAAWFPEVLDGELVVLRRHVPGNVTAFQRWYADHEVARLARYQDAPMRADEIDRFFQLRALGHESLTMAIHERTANRLIGSSAFSQVDGENGSAMYHITIGEKDVWGRGYSTEATQ